MKCILSIIKKGILSCISTWATASILLLLAACSANDLDTPTPLEPTVEETDSLGTFTLTLTGEKATRSTSTVITKEEADNFLVTIYKGSDIVRQTAKLKDINTSLPAGYGYKVFAESVSEETAITFDEGWGCKRFAGLSASFAIKAGQTTDVSVGCSVANAGFDVVFDESVAEYFTTSYDIPIHDGDRTIVFDAATAGKKVDGIITEGKTAYFNLDEEGHHTISYTIKAVGPKTIEKSGTLELSKSKVSRITLNYERSDFDFVITLDESVMYIDDVANFTEDDITVEDGSTEIIASHEPYTADGTAIQTRAVLGNDGTIVNWEASDVIAVYDFTASKHSFAAEIGADGRTKFYGKVTPRKPSFAAIYPYDLAAESAASASALSATLPSTQYAVADNIASALNISVAKGERNLDGSPSLVTFYNTCQLLRFSVPAYAAGKINSIQFTATTPIAGKLNINYSGDLPTTTIGSTESKVITILPPKNNSTFNAGTYYIAAAPGQMSGFTLTFACDGKSYTLTSPTTLAGKAGRIYSIGAIDLINTPSVSAEHIYSNDILQGTKVQLTGAPIEGGNWTATIKNANGTTVRTLSGTGDLISAETDASWPYLPKGNYTISYTFDRSNGTTQTATLPLSITDSPRFNVSFSTYTSYSYYIGDGVTKSTAEANKCANNVIYAPTLTVTGISNAILNNNNYTFTTGQTGFSTSLKSKSNGIFVFNDVTVTDWKAYTLTASLTFDGVKKEAASKTVQITGLPYTAAPPKNSGDHAWSEVKGGSKIDWNGDNVALGDGGTATADPTIKSPTFYLPADINISISSNGTLTSVKGDLFGWVFYAPTLNMFVGTNNVWSQKGQEKQATTINYSLSYNSTFSGSTNYLQFSTDTRTELSGHANIKNVKVQYR